MHLLALFLFLQSLHQFVLSFLFRCEHIFGFETFGIIRSGERNLIYKLFLSIILNQLHQYNDFANNNYKQISPL